MFRSIAVPAALLLLTAVSSRAEIDADGICRPSCTEDECTFEVRVNLYAAETGLYQVRSLWNNSHHFHSSIRFWWYASDTNPRFRSLRNATEQCPPLLVLKWGSHTVSSNKIKQTGCIPLVLRISQMVLTSMLMSLNPAFHPLEQRISPALKTIRAQLPCILSEENML